jgi:hypothetical protein
MGRNENDCFFVRLLIYTRVNVNGSFLRGGEKENKDEREKTSKQSR